MLQRSLVNVLWKKPAGTNFINIIVKVTQLKGCRHVNLHKTVMLDDTRYYIKSLANNDMCV